MEEVFHFQGFYFDLAPAVRDVGITYSCKASGFFPNYATSVVQQLQVSLLSPLHPQHSNCSVR